MMQNDKLKENAFVCKFV